MTSHDGRVQPENLTKSFLAGTEILRLQIRARGDEQEPWLFGDRSSCS